MADTELRANSLRVRFGRGVPEPTDSEIFKFMKTKLHLTSEKLLSMYKDNQEMSVIIKFKQEEDMRNTLRDMPGSMTFDYNKYESTEVKLSSANTIVRYVRLFGLPPEVEDREISAVMVRYGKIVRMVREKYGEETGFPIWTSVRGVYLELKEGVDVPDTLYIRNRRARVSYEGLVNKCYLCGSKDHLKIDCPKKKSVNSRLQEQQGTSYSGILKGGERWIRQKQDKPEGSGMVNLGQGIPKRTIAAQQKSVESNEERVMQEGEHSGTRGSHTALAHPTLDEHSAGDDHSDMCTDGTAAAGAEVEFTKVVSKRGRKQKSATNSTSDSDESPTGKVHRELTVLQATIGGTLSESLDRITRSKAKQKKVSDQDECSTEMDIAHTDEQEVDFNDDV